MTTTAAALREVAADKDLLYTVGRRAVEDVLIEHRDSGVSILGRGNGLVVNWPDGSPSSAVRLTVEHALSIALTAMADRLEAGT